MGSLLLLVRLVSVLTTAILLKLGLAVEELSCGIETRKGKRCIKCCVQLCKNLKVGKLKTSVDFGSSSLKDTCDWSWCFGLDALSCCLNLVKFAPIVMLRQDGGPFKRWLSSWERRRLFLLRLVSYLEIGFLRCPDTWLLLCLPAFHTVLQSHMACIRHDGCVQGLCRRSPNKSVSWVSHHSQTLSCATEQTETAVFAVDG